MQAAANSASENGKRPPEGKRRRSSSSTPVEQHDRRERQRHLAEPRARARAIPARTTARRMNATGLAREDEDGEEREAAATPRLQRPQCEQRERGAEGERERAGEDDARPDDGEGAVRPAAGRSPFPRDDDGERERRRRDAGDGEQLDPEQ